MRFPRIIACGALLGLCAVNGRAQTAATLLAPPVLTLGEAIRLALEKNQNIKVEAYAPAIAQAQVLQALGQFDPSLNFSRSYLRNYSTPGAGIPLTAAELVEEDNYSLTLKGVLPTGLQYSVGGTAQNARGPFDNFNDSFVSFGGINLTQPLLRGFGFG
ncbi:MAG TPA: hypothetical protein VHV47_01215, partial [Opitutaceae bacterium]|nr:hypothetical protein [Opitutaceae bacterium]